MRAGESRTLKVAGLVLLGIGATAVPFLQKQAESPTWLQQDVWWLALLASIYLIAGNLFALGIILVLAGFRNVALLADTRARRGVLVKLAGGNLLILLVGLIMVGDAGPWRDQYLIVIPGIALLVVVSRLGIGLLRTGWKYDAVRAERLLEEDTRAPVLYVRSFKDDDKIILGSGFRRWIQYVLVYLTAVSVEQELAFIMNRVGPVVAIGQPGELLPELGAARLYASDQEWRAKVTNLMRQARLVIVRAGSTANLEWEIDQAVQVVQRQRLIFISWAQSDGAVTFDEDVERRFGRPQPADPDPGRRWLGWVSMLMKPGEAAMGKIVYFDALARPRVEPIQFSLTWEGFATMAARPYRDSLQAACRRVFAHLELPWVDRKSRTTAILLAFFVGMFGVHHLYLGNRRRSLYYLAFFWTLLPILVAWIEGIRWVLMTEEDFERRVTKGSITISAEAS